MIGAPPPQTVPDRTSHDPSSGRLFKYLIAFIIGTAAFSGMAIIIGGWPRELSFLFGVAVAFVFVWLMRTRSLIFNLGAALVTLIVTGGLWVSTTVLKNVCQDRPPAAEDAAPTLLDRICSHADVRDALEIFSTFLQPSYKNVLIVGVFALGLGLMILMLARPRTPR